MKPYLYFVVVAGIERQSPVLASLSLCSLALKFSLASFASSVKFVVLASLTPVPPTFAEIQFNSVIVSAPLALFFLFWPSLLTLFQGFQTSFSHFFCLRSFRPSSCISFFLESFSPSASSNNGIMYICPEHFYGLGNFLPEEPFKKQVSVVYWTLHYMKNWVTWSSKVTSKISPNFTPLNSAFFVLPKSMLWALVHLMHTCPIYTNTNRQETLTNGTIGKNITIRQRSLTIRTIGTNGNLLSPLVYHL